ncbi:MAG: tetratricopeptide repeat protein [Terriglobales bacterium]
MRAYTRHQLKQDAFAETVKEQVSWVVVHRKKLVTAGIIVGVALVAALGAWAYLNHRNQQAGTALGLAMTVYQAPIVPPGTPAQPEIRTFDSAAERARAAHAEFQKVADEYSHTKSGEIARYFAALTATDMGDTMAGEKELKQVASSANSDLASLAKLALANRYRDANRIQDAIPLYKELIDNPTRTVAKGTVQLELASAYEISNQKLEAAKIYEQIMKEDANSPAARIVARQNRR